MTQFLLAVNKSAGRPGRVTMEVRLGEAGPRVTGWEEEEGEREGDRGRRRRRRRSLKESWRHSQVFFVAHFRLSDKQTSQHGPD